MRMTDFEYDGKLLSSFNMIPAGFNMESDEQNVGNHITMSDLKSPHRDEYYALGSGYDEPFNIEIEITKLNCKNEDFVLSDIEINQLMRWLNRKGYKKFKPLYDHGEFPDVYYMVTFNVTPLKAGQQIIGLRLELRANAPYAFVEDVILNQEYALPEDELKITDPSNERGAKYADVEITCKENGELKLTNTLDPNNPVIIKNCKANEVITLYGKTKIIKSSFPSHIQLPNDFNYNFLRIVNTDDSSENIIKCSLQATVKITYRPIMKVGLIV